jgi:putative membrane protein
MGGQMGNYGGGNMGVGMLVTWVLLGLGFALLVRYATRPGRDEDKPKSALDILKERYARGEIGREEYEQKKRDLEE